MPSISMMIGFAAFAELIEKWGVDARTVRKWGADNAALVIEHCIQDLRTAIDSAQLEAITLEEAARVSGYSYSSIQKKVASGELDNVGQKGSPRVRRGDLPAKAKPPTGLAESILLNRR